MHGWRKRKFYLGHSKVQHACLRRGHTAFMVAIMQRQIVDMWILRPCLPACAKLVATHV